MSSTPTRLRAAEVGTGGIVTGSHLPAPRTHANRIELRAAVDVDPARLDAFRAEAGAMGMHIEGQADFDAMLDAVHPGPVLIDTPPSRHRAQTVAALNAGAWVLCEKPLCLSLAEYDEIAATETLRERTRRWSSSAEPASTSGFTPNAVALRACALGSCDEDGLRAGAGRLRPETVFSSLELVTGHLAFHGSGPAAQASGGQESFQEVLLEHHQGPDQQVRGKSCPV